MERNFKIIEGIMSITIAPRSSKIKQHVKGWLI